MVSHLAACRPGEVLPGGAADADNAVKGDAFIASAFPPPGTEHHGPAGGVHLPDPVGDFLVGAALFRLVRDEDRENDKGALSRGSALCDAPELPVYPRSCG